MRRWWTDASHRLELLQRANSNTWYIIAYERKEDNQEETVYVVGKVKKITYNGYTVQPLRGKDVSVNPDTPSMRIVDIYSPTDASYLTACALWQAQYDTLAAEKEEMRKAEIAANTARDTAMREAQRHCLHTNITIEEASAPGCDTREWHCADCGKWLRRAWSTYCDTDPTDEIGDWQWYTRSYFAEYASNPLPQNYRIYNELNQLITVDEEG